MNIWPQTTQARSSSGPRRRWGRRQLSQRVESDRAATNRVPQSTQTLAIFPTRLEAL